MGIQELTREGPVLRLEVQAREQVVRDVEPPTVPDGGLDGRHSVLATGDSGGFDRLVRFEGPDPPIPNRPCDGWRGVVDVEEEVERLDFEPLIEASSCFGVAFVPPVREAPAIDPHDLVDSGIAFEEFDRRGCAEGGDPGLRSGLAQRGEDGRLHDQVADPVAQAEEDFSGAAQVH